MKHLGSRTIETERLFLHSTEEKDLKILWEILKKEEISKLYLVTKINDDWEKEKTWQKKKLEQANFPNTYCWTIELKNTHEIIGQISVQDGPNKNREDIRDIGWFIDTPYQKKGYAYEAALEVLKYMFLEVEITSILTCVAKDNTASWKLMEKLGFQRLKTTHFVKYTLLEEKIEVYEYQLEKNIFLKEYFHKQELYISENVDKDPYIKHLTDDPILNIVGLVGCEKEETLEKYKNNSNYIVMNLDQLKEDKNADDKIQLDSLYQEVIEQYNNQDKYLIIESNHPQEIEDISILKGDIIIIRTCFNTCNNRYIKNPNLSLEELSSLQEQKQITRKDYHKLNEWIDKIDKI